MKITIPGRPIPAARMTGRSKWVNSTAKRYLAYKIEIGQWARGKIKTPSDKKISVEVTVYLHGKTTEMGKDGDVDNYLKSALDGLNKIAFIDDRQVVSATVEKIPCEVGKERMEIVLEEIV